jgi:hypothetical protein
MSTDALSMAAPGVGPASATAANTTSHSSAARRRRARLGPGPAAAAHPRALDGSKQGAASRAGSAFARVVGGRGRAVAAVLLYRLLTFWLPLAPGFVAFRYLQTRQHI